MIIAEEPKCGKGIICEIGQNHCGDMGLARKLIKLAKENGADLAKFQLYDHSKLYHDCSIPNCELSFDQADMLFNYGNEVGIEVFFSVFDVKRVQWCEKIGVKRYKIASYIRDHDLMDAMKSTHKPLIISVRDWDSEPEMPIGFWGGDIESLYCTGQYPTPIPSLSFATDYGHSIFDDDFDGFSDHTIGLDVAKIALARGANIIEKHFAIDHQTGVDAEWSMTPNELKELKRFEGIVKQVL